MKTDRDKIQERMARYAASIDDRDYDRLEACFAPEARADYNGALYEGRAAILALMRKMLDPLDVTQHLFTNFIIDIEGDSAMLSAGVIAQHVRHATPGGEIYMGGGRYAVELCRSGGEWQILRIVARRVWAHGNPDVMTHTDP